MADEIRTFGEISIMDTLIIKEITAQKMQEAGQIIRDGGIVAFPTETVYGLGASAYDDNAVKNIYKAKGRPSDNPLIVHIADIKDAEGVAREIPENAKKLMERFCPGPLTLILKKRHDISDTVTAGLDTVGVRIPSHPVAREFIKAAGVPIAAPSANLSGRPSPTAAEHVIADMKGRVDAIICAGKSSVGVESTIIDVTGSVPIVLRPGGITPNDIEDVCGSVMIDRHVTENVSLEEQPKCPGMKYRHYAPDAEVIVVEGTRQATAKKISELAEMKAGKKVGVLGEDLDGIGDMFISSGKNNKELASVLFGALRSFDENGIDTVFVQFCPDTGYGLAVKNRLYKAAGGNVIYTE